MAVGLTGALMSQRQHGKTFGKLKDALFGLISSLTAAIDAKDPYTCGHSDRVARVAVLDVCLAARRMAEIAGSLWLRSW